MKIYSKKDDKLILEVEEISIFREFNKIYLSYITEGKEVTEELKNNIIIKEG